MVQKKKTKVNKKTAATKINIAKRAKIAFALVSVLLLATACIGVTSLKSNYEILDKDRNSKVNLQLEVADTDPLRLQGLMGRTELAENTGMLFDFEEPGYYAMWMKDTLIPLDMVFLNPNMQVIMLADNRTPMTEDLINPCEVLYEKELDTGRTINVESFFEKCENFYLRPNNLTLYVIELPAGTIKDANIEIGDILLKK